MVKISDDAAKMVQYILSPFGVNFKEMLNVYQLSTEGGGEQEQKDKFLTMAEATAYAKSSRWTLRRWMVTKKLKIMKTNSARCGRLLISKQSLDAILESLCISGTPEKIQ